MPYLLDGLMLLACVAMLLASLRDIASRTIPNGITLALAITALILRIAEHELPGALIAGSIVFIFAFSCWKLRLIGGGDVKLLAAAALAVPPGQVATYVLTVALAGGALALSYVTLSRFLQLPPGPRPKHLLPRIIRAELWRIRGRRSLPYACAIAAGACITMLQG